MSRTAVVILAGREQRYECPKGCGAVKIAHGPIARGTFDMHVCPALNFICTPLVPVTGTEFDPRSVNVTAVEREDYEGDEIVHKDSTGRPIMAVNVERRDGSNDRVVFPGTARLPVEGQQ